MSISSRAKRRVLLTVSAIMFAAMSSGGSKAAPTETLDAPSIRTLYASLAADIKDPQKVQTDMQDRLSETFMVTGSVTTIFGNNAPQTMQKASNKEQAIADAAAGFKAMQIDKYISTVRSVKVAPDNSSALVKDTTTAKGGMSLPLDAQHFLPAKFVDVEDCSDLVSLVSGRLTIMHSDCVDKLTITKAADQ